MAKRAGASSLLSVAAAADDDDERPTPRPAANPVKRGRPSGSNAANTTAQPHWACKHCNKFFSAGNNARAHVRLKHPREYEKAGGGRAKYEDFAEYRQGQQVLSTHDSI